MARIKTVASALTAAARRCSIAPPSAWATASSTAHVELRDQFMAQVVADILDRIDPPKPIAAATTLVGSGSETYTLPSDFRRLTRSRFKIYQEGYPTKAFCAVESNGDYDAIKDQGAAGGVRYYRIYDYQGAPAIDLLLAPSVGEDTVVNYVSENWIWNGTADTDEFTDDATDYSYIPRELLVAGIVYRFREAKGLDYGDAMSEFETKLARYANRSNTTTVVGPSSGPRPNAFAWVDAVPDVIPPS